MFVPDVIEAYIMNHYWYATSTALVMLAILFFSDLGLRRRNSKSGISLTMLFMIALFVLIVLNMLGIVGNNT